MIRRSLVPLILAVTLGFAPAAHAQYFGQNKVQYEKFDFKVLKTDHFDIYYYQEEEAAVQLAARMAERWYARLSKVLGHELSGRQPLILYAAHPHFQQTNVLEGEIGEGTGGVTESARRRIILPFAGGLAETDHVLGHELVHAFQYDIGAQNARSPSSSAMGSLPLWFVEGMAEYLSLGPIDAQTAMWVRDAAAREKMPTVDKLSDPNFFPYRYGHAFWAYVGGHWGDKAISDLLFATANGATIDTALETVLGVDKKTFTAMWHDETKRMYASYFEATQPPSSFGRALITRDTGGGDMNVSPALSPDGKRVVFLSERSLFAIDMYVADVATGKVTRTLVKTEGDPHFESLQFIDSAGDWSPDNHRFVFSALAKGKPVLTLLDVDSGKREAEYPIPDVDEIFNPAWAPDGRRIAFTAIHGGLLDLYVFDLMSHKTTQLTNDSFADYDPEWSPDGTSIAWVTDRFSAQPDAMKFGGYRIGLLDVATQNARPLAGFPVGMNTNPEFSADGQTLFFIGTPDGITNVYRVSVAGGDPVQVTNVLSGINGITPLTPALTVAAKADVMVFTAFEDNSYNLYVTDRPSRASTRGASISRNAAALPPEARTAPEVLAYLQAPATGLPASTPYNPEDYHPKLGLEDIVQPSVGVGVGRFGAFAAGSLGMVFRDTLGNHELSTSLVLTSNLAEIGGAAMYVNKTHRWNWGIIGEQIPYVSGGFSEGLVSVNGQTVVAQQELRIVQRNSAVTGVLQYPLSRAQRVEVSGGVRHIGYTNHVETRFYSPNTGQLLDTQKQDLPTQDGLTLGEASGALVYDSSIFGATSPILGERYRLEYTQSAGTLLYSGIMADVRKYFMPVRPFTIALRGLTYGRYGRDSDDLRLSAIDLGSPGLVRGYDWGSFESQECLGTGASCPAADSLLGSRIAVGNVELRFPLVGAFSRRSYYGPLPLEVAVFADAGMAWTSTLTPRFFNSGDRDWVKSVGTALRFNLFGYMIGEIDYVKPIDRPDKGWYWQFNFIPGF
jgi:Tol biopolymer transport system component